MDTILRARQFAHCVYHLVLHAINYIFAKAV